MRGTLRLVTSEESIPAARRKRNGWIGLQSGPLAPRAVASRVLKRGLLSYCSTVRGAPLAERADHSQLQSRAELVVVGRGDRLRVGFTELLDGCRLHDRRGGLLGRRGG